LNEDFCSTLNEQIVDERKAVQAYRRLLDQFEQEKDLLIDPANPIAKEYYEVKRAGIERIVQEEESHREYLEDTRKRLCETVI